MDASTSGRAWLTGVYRVAVVTLLAGIWATLNFSGVRLGPGDGGDAGAGPGAAAQRGLAEVGAGAGAEAAGGPIRVDLTHLNGRRLADSGASSEGSGASGGSSGGSAGDSPGGGARLPVEAASEIVKVDLRQIYGRKLRRRELPVTVENRTYDPVKVEAVE